MKYAFEEHEKNFVEWCKAGYAVALSDPQKLKVRDFLKNIDDPNFVPPLYRHQAEAVKRIIYSYEIIGKKDLLVEVVTGGGKSAIIAGVIAYFMIVHDMSKFLILVPNTIGRAIAMELASLGHELLLSYLDFSADGRCDDSFAEKTRKEIETLAVGRCLATDVPPVTNRSCG
jgi:hypothetical protein